MISKPVMFGVLAASCIAAAGAGAYLAARQPNPVAATAAVENASMGKSATGVEASEAVVQDVPEAPTATAPIAETAGARPAPQARTSPPTRVRPAPARQPAARISAPPVEPAPAAPARESANTAANNEGWTGLEKTWPTRDTTASESPRTPAVDSTGGESVPAARPARRLEELVISADSVIGLQVETAVNSEQARLEDKVEARVIRDVKVGSDVAIPAGSRAIGSITVVDKGGRMRDRARLGIRFHTIVLGDGTEVPMQTETLYREGTSPTRESAAKVGGATVGGAILGAILGGKKGAVLGGAAGAAGGTAAVMAGDRNPATLPAGTTVTVRVAEPTTVTVERERQDQ